MTLDQGRDVAVVRPGQQIAFPMARHRPIFNRRRSLMIWKRASAEGRADPLKIRCRGSSRSTLPCFLFFRKADFPARKLFPAKRYSLAVPYVNYGRLRAGPIHPPDQRAIIVGECCASLAQVCFASVDLIASATSPRDGSEQIRFPEFR